jgi:hypothetical protein
VVLTDLNYQVWKHLLNAMLGIEDHRLDVKASVFKIPSSFFVNRLVFGGNRLPIQVLFQARTAYNNNAITSAEETAIYSDYNRAYWLGT